MLSSQDGMGITDRRGCIYPLEVDQRCGGGSKSGDNDGRVVKSGDKLKQRRRGIFRTRTSFLFIPDIKYPGPNST